MADATFGVRRQMWFPKPLIPPAIVLDEFTLNPFSSAAYERLSNVAPALHYTLQQ
jgi:hypothetical protein